MQPGMRTDCKAVMGHTVCADSALFCKMSLGKAARPFPQGRFAAESMGHSVQAYVVGKEVRLSNIKISSVSPE